MARDSIVAAVVVAALGSLSFASAQPPSTQLIIEISGGFAFIPDNSDRRLHVAYLNSEYIGPDTDTNGDGMINNDDQAVCDVQQIGTELQVVRGEVIESLPTNKRPANRSYDLNGARIRFPDANGAMPAYTRTPGTPTNITAPTAWTDTRFVPSIKEYHSGSDIIGGYKNAVNGFMTLRGGNITATTPTDPLVQNTYFEFRQNGVVRGHSAVTDKVIYSTVIPRNYVEIAFSQSIHKFIRVRIAPPASGGPVRLRLRGLHSMNSAASYANGDEIKDFCAFYSLFKKTPTSQEPTPMSSSERLKMFYVNNNPLTPGGDQPSPGFFCDGSWF